MKLRIGGFCVKGSGHSYTYGEGEGADGCDGWPMFIEIEAEDIHLFPDWIQELYREEEKAGLTYKTPYCPECGHSYARHSAGNGTCNCGCIAWSKPTERDIEDGRRIAAMLGYLKEDE